jgi:molecular chaperone IbpA
MTHVAQLEDMAMRTFDPTPLWRSTIGFDRLFDLMDQSAHFQANDSYPPYNIERAGEDHYRISLALAGFSPDEVTITAEQNVLTVEGSKAQKPETEYLYQGISARPFRRVFNLADYVQVKSASFEDGLLKIELVREVPEAMKPRRIAINGGVTKPTIEQKKAA